MLKSLFPVFITEQLELAREFYVNHLNFCVVFEADWYVQLHADREIKPPLELAFMLPNRSEQHPAVQPSFSGSGIILTFEFEEVDAVYTKLVERNAPIELIQEIRDEPWGQRHFMFRDPADIIVDVVQPIRPSTEYDMSYNNQVDQQ